MREREREGTRESRRVRERETGKGQDRRERHERRKQETERAEKDNRRKDRGIEREGGMMVVMMMIMMMKRLLIMMMMMSPVAESSHRQVGAKRPPSDRTNLQYHGQTAGGDQSCRWQTTAPHDCPACQLKIINSLFVIIIIIITTTIIPTEDCRESSQEKGATVQMT